MIKAETKYRFLKTTKVLGPQMDHVVVSEGTEFETNSQGAYDFKLKGYSKTIPEYVLESWLEDERIECLGEWKPKNGELFFFVGSCGNVTAENFSPGSKFHLNLREFGNCFETMEEAMAVRDNMLVLFDAVKGFKVTITTV